MNTPTMSSVSVTSSKRENQVSELMQELDSIRTMNSSLRAYLEHLKLFKKNVVAMNENLKQLSKVNTQWVNTINMI